VQPHLQPGSRIETHNINARYSTPRYVSAHRRINADRPT
jgi:hypothetical protein